MALAPFNFGKVKDISENIRIAQRAEAKGLAVRGPFAINGVWRVQDGRSEALVVLLEDRLFCWDCGRASCPHVAAVEHCKHDEDCPANEQQGA